MIVEPTDSDLEQWEVRMYDGKGATGVSSSSALTSSRIAMATHEFYRSSFSRELWKIWSKLSGADSSA